MTIIALDVGSTNSRAWLLEAGMVRARATSPVGVRDAAAGSSDTIPMAVRDLVNRVSAEAAPEAIVAAGMITSSLGLRAVPHVSAPAGIDDLGPAALTYVDERVSALPITLLPGVRTDHTDLLERDVMRGEETLIIGLLRQGAITPGGAVLSTGSHWKLIAVDDRGRIAWSRTSLGGELIHAVARHTILAESLPAGSLPSVDAVWLEKGMHASRSAGLLRALFGVRLLHQQGETTALQRQSWLVGASIGVDVDAMLNSGALHRLAPIVVTGPGAMPEAWSRVLRLRGIEAAPLPAMDAERAFLSGVTAIFERTPARARA